MATIRIAVFDDVIAARGDEFAIPGLEVEVHPHADDAVDVCARHRCDFVFMDFSMGASHNDGGTATRQLRAAGFRGKIIAISTDRSANAVIRSCGADDALARKSDLRGYLMRLARAPLGNR